MAKAMKTSVMHKRMILFMVMMVIAVMAMGQTQPTKEAGKNSTVKVEKVGNKTFKATKQKGSRGSGYRKTEYSYQDTDGNTYEIYLHVVSRGDSAGVTKCYIQRTSKKTGKSYWKEIPLKPEELK